MFYQETAKEYSAYADYVRKQVPSITELVTPRPLPVTSYQQLLQPDEALIATLVTPRDLYVWCLTRRGVAMSRQRITEREVGELVTRLRAGLTPASSGGRTTRAGLRCRRGVRDLPAGVRAGRRVRSRT